jgi:hypothetical protein
VNDWGQRVYGDPCRECGFRWGSGLDSAVTLVAATPATFAELLAGSDGTERHPSLEWSAVDYVCHVGDNFRIWAERLMGIVGGASPQIASYDENELARVRSYASVPLPAALWSLRRAASDWVTAVQASPQTGTVLIHPERGDLTLSDVADANAHDAFHHQRDIELILQAAGHQS